MTDNRELASEFLRAVGDMGVEEAAAAYGAPDLNWWTIGIGDITPLLPILSRVIAENVDDDGLRMEVLSTTVEGQRVAAEAVSHARLRNGSVYNNHYHFLIEIADGKVRTVKEYHDTAHTADVWGAAFAEAMA